MADVSTGRSSGRVCAGSSSRAKANAAAGTAVEAKGGDGRTPLMVAAAKGRIAVVQLLLDRGADATLEEDKGRTALALATQRDHRTIQQVLRAAGAK